MLDSLLGKSIKCSFGERADSDPSHQLMYEGKDFDEYFVPIPLKCIGNKFYNQDDLDDDGKEMLKNISNYYHYFKDQNNPQFSLFWDKHSDSHDPNLDSIAKGPFGKVRMKTEKGKGYYEVLEGYKNNVLIGYSQGGLVARYLAFLDEHVFKKNLITAIITIASPNYGSPLANPNNKDSVANGIGKILLALLSLYEADFRNLYEHSKLSYSFLYDAILKAYEDIQDKEHPIKNLLITALKWLSGLEGNKNSAFDELDIQNYDGKKEYSVLNLVKKYPLKRIYYGAVVTANNNLDDILHSILGSIGNLVYWGLKLFKLWDRSISDNIKEASRVYRDKVMKETPTPDPTPFMNELVNRYNNGFEVPKSKPSKIKALAHDFIIPSAYQVLPPGDNLLGHFINEKANHNSGKSKEFQPGSENFEYIKKLLKELKKRL